MKQVLACGIATVSAVKYQCAAPGFQAQGQASLAGPGGVQYASYQYPGGQPDYSCCGVCQQAPARPCAVPVLNGGSVGVPNAGSIPVPQACQERPACYRPQPEPLCQAPLPLA